MKRYILTLLFTLTVASCTQKQMLAPSKDYILWYDQPARIWEEALPLGNGRIGVMVFGKTANERIQLNDDSMWPGNPGWTEPAGRPEDLEKIRQLLFENRNAEADAMFVEKFSRKSIVRSHQTLGELYLDFKHKNISEYRRELNISRAVATTAYRAEGQWVTEKVFVSHPHQAIIIEITSEAEEGLNGRIRLDRPLDKGHATVTVSATDDMRLVMSGEVTQLGGVFDNEDFPITDGVKFETCLKAEHEGGEIINGQDFLELSNVQKARFYIVSNSSYYHKDYSRQNQKQLALLSEKKLKQLENAHVQDFQRYFSRVDLKLTNDQKDSLTTDKRLKEIQSGGLDLALEELLFQYGRYLLISSSRENTLPANLQGLWNEHIYAPWNCDYHLNINLQMNYWLANVTNLMELNFPLFDYIDRLIENGQKTAQINYGCRGSFIPHATDLWAPTWLRAPTAYWGCSIGAGGWLMNHYWEYFDFTRDTLFLKDRAFPAIQEVAQFYSDWIIKDPRDGKWISAPSTSPENRFIHESGQLVATCLGSAMDQQIIAEIFDHYIRSCQILNIEGLLLTKIIQQRTQLRDGFILGSDGRILEWDREYEEPEKGHRHMSHLYGFHPGTAVQHDRNPELIQAIRNTLNYRLAHGGAGTGWSRAWLINLSARLLDGEMAHEHIQLLIKKSLYDNLFDAHPPFQIDGNFGYTAGVAEMLVQSHEEDTLRLLPALPHSWKNGHVKGLKARGGLLVDIYWCDHVLKEVLILSAFKNEFIIKYKDMTHSVKMKKGEVLNLHSNDF
ncbi:MAG: glycoside hydrolase family 95 protein [Candidatus Marinimicrobia bacterium]|nr:glycoside hydrolase family 95 protein [Candidatus Neomarinimicrobiota bacterium]